MNTKTEILDTIQVDKPLMLIGTLILDSDNIALLKGKHKLGEKPILQVEIIGSNSKLIDVSYLRGLNTGLGFRTMFPYKNGFGIIDHDHAKFHLWENISATPKEITVEQRSSDKQLDLFKNYLEYVSYDDTTDTFVIGIGAKHSPHSFAKWFAKLTLKSEKNQDTVISYWEHPYQLKLEDYPQTRYHYLYPELEWLNINDFITHNGKKYIICRGGKRTIGKRGVRFEFNVLSVYDSQNRMCNKIELEFGEGKFSSDKQYFIFQPINKKRLLVYNLETLELVYNIPLKTASNMGSIPINYWVTADLKNSLLYIKQLYTLNICKLIE